MVTAELTDEEFVKYYRNLVAKEVGEKATPTPAKVRYEAHGHHAESH